MHQRITILLLLALLLGFAAGVFAVDSQSFDELKFRAFMEHAAQFERELYGCPVEAYREQQCDAEAGLFDSKLKERVWKEGRELFGR